MQNMTDTIDRLRKRICESDGIGEDDKDALLSFSDEMAFRDTEYTDDRHVKHLQTCTMLAGDSTKYDPEQLPDAELVAVLDDEAAVKEFGSWIGRNFESEETKRDYRVAIRIFGKLVGEGNDVPEPCKLLSAGTPRNYDPMPDPSEMLHWEEHILPMVEEARHLRDKAAITVAWDSGARSGEFCGLQVGDVTDHKHGKKISVDGKTGQRSILLIPSAAYLERWLSVHPARDDPNAPLWCKLDSPEEISYRMKLKMLKRPARKAGIDHTDITFRRMRKSSASHKASQNVNQAHLEDHHGWTRGSDEAARYISVFGEANDREIARAHGVEVEEEESEPIAPLHCPRCERETPREEDFCVWCGQAMDQGAAKQVEEEQRELRTDLLRLAREDEEFLDTVDRLEELFDVIDSNPEVIRDARDFAGVADD